MTNDTTTLNGALNELGETLAENLTEKGVTADASEGLTTLANKIKDITFDLSATLTLTSGVNEVLLNQIAYFSASLININDQPIANGVIIFKDTGTDTVLGSCVTDETGMSTFNHIIDDFGSFNIQAEFLGLDGCTSNTVTINCNYDLNITSDKDILSSYDNDSCTITANLLNSNNEPIESEDIDYRVVHGETEIDSGILTTNIDGDISVDYDATGIGDVEVIFSLRSLLQKTYAIIDAQYHASNDYINAHLTEFEGKACFLPYVVEYGDKVCFKFNSKPIHCLVGIGTSSKSSLVWEFNTNQTKVHRSYLTGMTYPSNWLITQNIEVLGLEVNKLNDNEDKTNIYFNETYYDYYRNQLRSDNNTIRVDKFTNDDYDIEVYVL